MQLKSDGLILLLSFCSANEVRNHAKDEDFLALTPL